MPVWHEAAREWVRDGKLVILGVIQEQHPDRCSLFAQWQGFDWPILHDPVNALRLTAVPIVTAIDEHGVVRAVGPKPETFEADFLSRTFSEEPPPKPTKPREPAIDSLLRSSRQTNTADAWRDAGDALVLWRGAKRASDAIDAYQQADALAPDDPNVLFRMGVAYRMRYESEQRQTGDFQAAVDRWGRALAIDPNQYIWRRRIQQYGPRLDKPYSFYDWVHEARAQIAARGETPHPLAVEPGGAEFAYPGEFTAQATPLAEPDAAGRINRDTRGFIRAEVAVVPARVKPGETARVHVTFFPDLNKKAHWNNEVEPTRLWITPPDGWAVSERVVEAPLAEGVETQEVRHVDFEVLAPASARGGATLKAYALYYVCEGVGGTCLFLRQDLEIPVRLAE